MTRQSGYRLISKERWYGAGYCAICGDEQVIPMACRYWDPDDGWRMGVLCACCTEDAKGRPPRPGDYAYRDPAGNRDQAARIDVTATHSDLDAAYSDQD